MKGIRIGELLALLGAGTFALSVAFVYGYSLGADVNLFLYTSLTDLTRISILWMPLTLLLLVVGLVFADPGALAVLKGTRSKNVRKRSKYLDLIPMFVIFLAALTSVSYWQGFVPRSFFLASLGIALPFGWLWLGFSVLDRSKVVQELPLSISLSVIVIPSAFLLAFAQGLASGADGEWSFLPSGRGEIRTELGRDSAMVLMSLGDYVIIRHLSRDSIIVIPRSEIARISHPAKTDRARDPSSRSGGAQEATTDSANGDARAEESKP